MWLTFIADINKPFLSKEKATSYLRSRRVKRDINEECSETEGCWHEEIREIGVSDVVNIITNINYNKEELKCNR